MDMSDGFQSQTNYLAAAAYSSAVFIHFGEKASLRTPTYRGRLSSIKRNLIMAIIEAIKSLLFFIKKWTFAKNMKQESKCHNQRSSNKQ